MFDVQSWRAFRTFRPLSGFSAGLSFRVAERIFFLQMGHVPPLRLRSSAAECREAARAPTRLVCKFRSMSCNNCRPAWLMRTCSSVLQQSGTFAGARGAGGKGLRTGINYSVTGVVPVNPLNWSDKLNLVAVFVLGIVFVVVEQAAACTGRPPLLADQLAACTGRPPVRNKV